MTIKIIETGFDDVQTKVWADEDAAENVFEGSDIRAVAAEAASTLMRSYAGFRIMDGCDSAAVNAVFNGEDDRVDLIADQVNEAVTELFNQLCRIARQGAAEL